MILSLLVGCDGDAGELSLPLRWVRGGDETWDQVEAGLAWDLANLGVEPEGFANADVGDDGASFTLFARGWPNEDAWAAALAPLRASDEVATTGAMDVGRFLMETLYAPGRYYAITGACGTRASWEDTHLRDVETYLVEQSLLVSGQRHVRYDIDAMAFTSTEGHGEDEMVDVMDNGQQRYALYGDDGGLRAWAETSPAGQPGRCMWCHESTIQAGDPENPGHDAFATEIALVDAEMAARRARWPLPVDPVAHEWGEWLVVQFLEPSRARVAREWGVDEAAVPDLPTHENAEYPAWGLLLDRADVDAYASFAPIPVPADSREPDSLATLDGAEDLGPCE